VITKVWIETQKSRAARGGRPRYRVRWIDPLGLQSEGPFVTKAAAREFRDTLQGQIAVGSYTSPSLTTITISSLIDHFFTVWVGKASTLAGYRNVNRVFIGRELHAVLDGREVRICMGDKSLRELADSPASIAFGSVCCRSNGAGAGARCRRGRCISQSRCSAAS
jgi:hypothetical protein